MLMPKNKDPNGDGEHRDPFKQPRIAHQVLGDTSRAFGGWGDHPWDQKRSDLAHVPTAVPSILGLRGCSSAVAQLSGA